MGLLGETQDLAIALDTHYLGSTNLKMFIDTSPLRAVEAGASKLLPNWLPAPETKQGGVQGLFQRL